MKSSKRNLLIQLAVLGAVFYGTSLVMSSTVIPRQIDNEELHKVKYVRQLQMQLLGHISEKRFNEAEITYRRIIKLDKNNRRVRRLGSVALFRNGKYTECAKELRSLLLSDPGDFISRNNYAMVLFKQNDPRAMSEFFRAWEESGHSAFVGENLRFCAGKFKMELSVKKDPSEDRSAFLGAVPIDGLKVEEEKK